MVGRTPARTSSPRPGACSAAAQRDDAAFLVHASYAFLEGAEGGSSVGERMRPIVDAAREAERMVLESGQRACVVRLGYLYGPQWRDLRAYRRAFRLGRPYWAGPRRNLQHHLYCDDAARALLTAAQRRPSGRLTYASDGTPASFADFMDHFARLVGSLASAAPARRVAPVRAAGGARAAHGDGGDGRHRPGRAAAAGLAAARHRLP